jgi:NAD-reducing hydrogenase small subunit
MERLKLATVWLGGCSGCHMSFLDLDEWLFDLADRVDLVYSPIADIKHFPDNVDLALVEGAIANEENLALARRIRQRSRVVISFGDCAVNGNVTAMRNPHGLGLEIVRTCYLVPEPNPSEPVVLPNDPEIVPPLLDRVVALHQVIPVDHFLPGCPPPAGRIRQILEELLAGQSPARTPALIRFG